MASPCIWTSKKRPTSLQKTKQPNFTQCVLYSDVLLCLFHIWWPVQHPVNVSSKVLLLSMLTNGQHSINFHYNIFQTIVKINPNWQRFPTMISVLCLDPYGMFISVSSATYNQCHTTNIAIAELQQTQPIKFFTFFSLF